MKAVLAPAHGGPAVHARFPLADAPDVIEQLGAGIATGKTAIIVRDTDADHVE